MKIIIYIEIAVAKENKNNYADPCNLECANTTLVLQFEIYVLRVKPDARTLTPNGFTSP